MLVGWHWRSSINGAQVVIEAIDEAAKTYTVRLISGASVREGASAAGETLVVEAHNLMNATSAEARSNFSAASATFESGSARRARRGLQADASALEAMGRNAIAQPKVAKARPPPPKQIAELTSADLDTSSAPIVHSTATSEVRTAVLRATGARCV